MAMLRPIARALCAAFLPLACFTPPDGGDEAATGDVSPTVGTGQSGDRTTGPGPEDSSDTSGGSAADASSSSETGSTTGGLRGGEMIEIPGGTFMMGCDPVNDATCVDNPVHPHILTERPRHEVTLSAYAIDRTEVTLGEYNACVEDGMCSEPGSN